MSQCVCVYLNSSFRETMALKPTRLTPVSERSQTKPRVPVTTPFAPTCNELQLSGTCSPDLGRLPTNKSSSVCHLIAIGYICH